MQRSQLETNKVEGYGSHFQSDGMGGGWGMVPGRDLYAVGQADLLWNVVCHVSGVGSATDARWCDGSERLRFTGAWAMDADAGRSMESRPMGTGSISRKIPCSLPCSCMSGIL